MSKVFQLAYNGLCMELTSLRTSILIFFFALFNGIFFYNQLDMYVSSQNSLYSQIHGNTSFASFLDSYFTSLKILLVLVIPAITMASFSEERRTGRIRLLLSSSTQSLQIVLSKFLSILAVILLLLSITSVYFAFLVAHGNPDLGVVFSSYLGIFLLSLSQVAFGLWVSSLCVSQLTAFIFSLMGVFFMLIVSTVASFIRGDGVWFDLARFVGASAHLKPFLQGVVTTMDTTYFVSLITFFLFLTVCVVDMWRWR